MRIVALAAAIGLAGAPLGAAEWTRLFDGVSLEGWKTPPIPRSGAVTVKDGTIVLGKGAMTGIAWTGPFPKSNYEIRFEAARIEGNDFFAGLTFPVGDSHCFWVNGGWGGDTVGLSNVDGYDASENETSINRDFVNGRWYRFHLEVTPARIRARINGSLVIDLEIAGRLIALRFDDTDLCKPLGFASYGTIGALRNIEYRVVETSR